MFNLKRKKLYELELSFHCPLVGLCIKYSEGIKFVRKYFTYDRHPTEYELHNFLVNLIARNEKETVAIQKYLNKKYLKYLKDVEKIHNDDELLKYFYEKMEKGELAGAFYSIIIQKKVSENVKIKIYEIVHMLGHTNITEINKLTKENFNHKELIKKLNYEIKELKRNYKLQSNKYQIEIKKLEETNSNLKRKILNWELLEKEKHFQKISSSMVKMGEELAQLKNEYNNLKAINDRYELLISNLKNKIERYKKEINQLTNLNSIQQNKIKELFAMLSKDCENCSAEMCPRLNLQGKTILFVGGMEKNESVLKNIVKESGGFFLRYDGVFQKGINAMLPAIKKSDLVICPIECISHNSVLLVKKICKKFNKKYIFIRKPSKTSFVDALMEA